MADRPDTTSALAWWRLYPPASRTRRRKPFWAKAPFQVGDAVRLKARPAASRRVLSVEWHPFCGEFCFYIETSTSRAGEPCPAYWFAAQLERA